MSSSADKIIAENFTQIQALSCLSREKSRLEEKAFEKDKIEIEKIPELVIFSAFPVTDEIFVDLGRKARSLFGKNLFIDLKVDVGLIGGAALVWKGQYKDYSLKAKFEEQKEILKGVYEQFTQDRRSRLCPER